MKAYAKTGVDFVAKALTAKRGDSVSARKAVVSLFGGENGMRALESHVMRVDAYHASSFNRITKPLVDRNTPEPATLSQKFHKACMYWCEKSRPSVPAFAAHAVATLKKDYRAINGLPIKLDALERAIALTALRAEMVHGKVPGISRPNAYHDALHTLNVATLTFAMIETNNRQSAQDPQVEKLDLRQRYILLLAAIGHDIDHPGVGNPPSNHYKNENASFATLRKIMIHAGVGQDDQDAIETLIRTTSPNGPHAVMKQAAVAHHAGEKPDWDKIDPSGKFPELQTLNSPKLAEMAAILSDADLGASAGFGFDMNQEMSRRLTGEAKYAGQAIDFTTPQARAFFIEKIVGEQGFASRAGGALMNDAFQELHSQTQRVIASQKAAAANTAKP